MQNDVGIEPRPLGVRILALGLDERREVARWRFEYLCRLISASGCAVTPSPNDLAINFHTGENLLTLLVNNNDPRQIFLLMIFANKEGDFAKAQKACIEATSKQFASKGRAMPYGDGYEITLSIGIYAEELSAFTNSIKAYVDDIVKLYNDFLDSMVAQETANL